MDQDKIADPNQSGHEPSGAMAAYGFFFGAIVSGLALLLYRILRLSRDQRRVSIRPSLLTYLEGHPVQSTPFAVSEYAREISGASTPTKTIPPPATAGSGEQREKKTAQQTVPYPAAGKTRWNSTTKYIVAVALFIGLLGLLYISRSVLSLIIFAALLAFIVNPVVLFLERRLHLKRSAAVIAAFVLVVGVITLILLVLLPALIGAVNFVIAIDWQVILDNLSSGALNAAEVISRNPIFAATIVPILQTFSDTLSGFSETGQPAAGVYQPSITSIGDILAGTIGILSGVLGPIIAGIVSFSLMLIISLYFSFSSDSIRFGYKRLLPPGYEPEIADLIERIMNLWSQFLQGQLTLMLLMGVLVGLFNWAMGSPEPLLMGVIAGVLELIPNLGPLLAMVPAVILALIFGSSYLPVDPWLFALLIVVGYALLQLVENQWIVPKILGDAVNLPPLVVILGVTIGGAAFGLLGVFLATPVIASGKELCIYLYNKILEPPEPEPPPVYKPSIMARMLGYVRRIKLPVRRKSRNASQV